MAGRPRKPTQVLKIRGTAQNCRLKSQGREDELVVGGGFPDPPSWLDPLAIEEWERVRRISDYASAIKESDFAVMCLYCDLFAAFRKDRKRFSFSAAQLLASLAGKLGMTPADRSKVHVGKSEKKENPFAQFRSRPGQRSA